MPLVLSVFAPDAAAQSEAQPATVAGSELTRTSGALERLDDVDTLLSLTSEGALLYENDEVKLDGYQYCSQAVALAERGELRRSVQAASKALHVALQSGHNDLLGTAYRDLAITFSYAGSLERAEAFARLALEHPATDPTQTEGPAHKTIGDVRVRQQRYPEAIASSETRHEENQSELQSLVKASLAQAMICSNDLPRARQVTQAMATPAERHARKKVRGGN